MSARPCAIFDVDGTLADVSGIRHHVAARPKNFDAFHRESVNVPPHGWVADLARAVAAEPTDVVIVTARKHMWRNHTAMWLAMHDVPSVALFMRHDRDSRPDVDVKRDILARIRQTWTPILAVDDNPAILALWRAERIPTIHVPGWEA